MTNKITVIGGSGFVGTNLCKRLSFKRQDFEIIDIKMSNQFPEKCKIGDVRDIVALRKTITGRFLKRKLQEYEALKAEIDALMAEVDRIEIPGIGV